MTTGEEDISPDDGLKGQTSSCSSTMDIPANLSFSVLPLLQMQPTNNLTKHDVNNLVRTIINMEPYILNFDLSFSNENASFFASFVALSANCIISNASAIPKSQVQLTSNACSILIQYLLHYLTVCDERTTLMKLQLITLLQGLCDDVPPLSKSDIISLCAIIKSCKVPYDLSLRQSDQLGLESFQSTSTSRADSEEMKEPKKLRLDHTCDSLVEQLMTPIVDLNRKDFSDKNIISQSSFQFTPDTKPILLIKNLFNVQQFGGSNVLLDFILSLPSMLSYIQQVHAAEEGAPLRLPSNTSDALNIMKGCKLLIKEYDVACRALSLPILEPLTEDRLNKVITIIQTYLYISLTMVAASSILSMSCSNSNKASLINGSSGTSISFKEGEEESDNCYVSEIVEKSIEIYNKIMQVMKKSVRVGGQCCQNAHLFTCWMLLTGFKYILNLNPPKCNAKGDTLDPCGAKLKGYSTLCIPLASHVVKTLASLLEDLKYEAGLPNQTCIRIEKLISGNSNSFKHNKFGCYSAWQRIEMLMSNINLTNLLFSLASVGYRKAGILRLLKHYHLATLVSASPSHDQGIDVTSANSGIGGQVSDIDDEYWISSDDSSRDDDLEPILKRLFKENEREENKKQDCNKLSAMKPRSPPYNYDKIDMDNREAHRHLSLGLQILELFNRHFICSEIESLRLYFKATFSDPQIVILANMIKDLDRESMAHSNGFYLDFSRCLTSFMHNLVATELLSPRHQNTLLTHLGINPSGGINSIWPLYIPPRALSILAQILLLKQRREKDAFRSDVNAPSLHIWQSLINHLKRLILKQEDLVDNSELEDINVEHAQLLVFIFHNLKVLQRKDVLLMLSKTIVEVSEVVTKPMSDHQIHYLGRLIHFFEYMMKFLYEPARSLIDQIDNNLFKCHALLASKRDKDNKDPGFISGYKLYFDCREIETNYAKRCSVIEEKAFARLLKPRFYYLMNMEIPSTKDVPKLDWMALNFILIGLNSEILNYDALYDSLCKILLVGTQLDLDNRIEKSKRISYFRVCTTQYCFNIAWSLLLQMPPSITYLESFVSGDFSKQPYKILSSVIWIPRITNRKTFFSWVRESLLKPIQIPCTRADLLLKNIIRTGNSLTCSVKTLTHFINTLLADSPNEREVIKPKNLPKRIDMFVLASLVTKTLVCLGSCFNLKENMAKIDCDEESFNEAKRCTLQLLPDIIKLISLYYSYIRWNILHSVGNVDENFRNTKTLQAYNILLRITSTKAPEKLSTFATSVNNLLPKTLIEAIEKWNLLHNGLYDLSRKESSPISSELIILSYEAFHFNSLAIEKLNDDTTFVFPNSSLKQVTSTLLGFAEDIFSVSVNAASCISNHHQSMIHKDFSNIVLPLGMDATLECFNTCCYHAIENIYGLKAGDDYICAIYISALKHAFELITDYSSYIDEKICIEIVEFIESLLDSTPGQNALEKFFCENEQSLDIVTLIISASSKNFSSAYAYKVLKFLVKLFEQTKKSMDTISLVRLCSSLTRLGCESKREHLYEWLCKLLLHSRNGYTDSSIQTIKENRSLLQLLTSYIVKESSAIDEEISNAFFKALISLGAEVLSENYDLKAFPDLLTIMSNLASVCSASGHFELIKAVFGWLEASYSRLSSNDVLDKLEEKDSTHSLIGSICYLLSYLSAILEAIKYLNDGPEKVGINDGEIEFCSGLDVDGEWNEEMGDEEESGEEESDDDSLYNKLCTFTITQKEFVSQYWYHCHTCQMVETVGVCTVCAKVCHKDHDVTFEKNGPFFCDCGAKPDGSCLALVKRAPTSIDQSASYRLPAYSSGSGSVQKQKRKASSPEKEESEEVKKAGAENQSRRQILAQQLEPKKDEILAFFESKNIEDTVIQLLHYLLSSIMKNCSNYSSVGCSIRAKKALKELHELDKSFEIRDNLMVPTLGSQEGAFENVRLNYSGDQGQTIRQLITTSVIRRVAMCALVSPFGKRQHLAVSHEKGKITLLQLSALLKQADPSRRKLTLSRLAYAPIPFTVLSMAPNPCNENFLAVCGLKDCHVLTFNSTGYVSGYLILHPQLEAGNHMTKAVWLPGTQTELALVTLDFVKIYDLSIDVNNPQYFFLLPSGKIRDITFWISDEASYVLLISLAGHIYCQIMSEESSAKNGPFYVTNIIDIKHPEVRETTGGEINSGGISIYYSHTFHLLFASYCNGKNFMCPMSQMVTEISHLYLIETTNSDGSKNGPSSSWTGKALCQWTEIQGHPGLILAMCQLSNNPVILMIKPDSIIIQEIQSTSSKAKITDMVALRHTNFSGELRTTMILLCEDGSLRIYMASSDNTNFWLRPEISSSTIPAKSKKKKTSKSYRANSSTSGVSSNGVITFPIDFFEHCSVLEDIEFGGNDMLQVYNVQQLKNRLNVNSLYVASTKPTSFSIEVYNNDPSTVIVGVRVLVGSQDINKAPSYIELFARSTNIYLTRSRWYDIPLTREESLMADKKLVLFFGASSDENNITMVDAIKVYGKTKESFAWPEDDGDVCNGTANGLNSNAVSSDTDVMSFASPWTTQISQLDRLLSCSIEVLESCFALGTLSESEENFYKQQSLSIATSLLTLPFPAVVQQNIKSLLMTLHNNKLAYDNHKDAAILNFVMKSLAEANETNELDGEAFYQLISSTKSIALSRPENLMRFSECFGSLIGKEKEHRNIKSTDFDFHLFDDEKKFDSSPKRPKNISKSSGKSGLKSTSAKGVSFSECTTKGIGDAFMVYLSETFWKLYSMKPKNPLLVSIASGGLVHVEATVQALVEIILSFTMVDSSTVSISSQLLMKLLLCKDSAISFSAKQSIVRMLRPKVKKKKLLISIPSPIRETPSSVLADNKEECTTHTAYPQQSQAGLENFGNMEGLDVSNYGVDDFIGAEGALAPLLDLNSADDDAIDWAFSIRLPSRELMEPIIEPRSTIPQRLVNLEDRGQYSDTTASAAASDDEGSTAATDGSTLRTSPIPNEPEPIGGGGSESGGSAAESIIGEHLSGRSSAYGEDGVSKNIKEAMENTESNGAEQIDASNAKLHNIRLYLLEKFVNNLSEMRGIGGTHCIPMMQTILMLSSDLDCDDERDKTVLNSMLDALVLELTLGDSSMIERTPENEVKLIIMRLLSILASRDKTGSKTDSHPGLCSMITAQVLINSEFLERCFNVLKNLLKYWKALQPEMEASKNAQSQPQLQQPSSATAITSSSLLKPYSLGSPPDMSPFFLKQYVKTHLDDVFELYPQLLTEMVLRLPYQITKMVSTGGKVLVFPSIWEEYLCEYMMIHLTPFVRKQVRKLLSFICGSKEKYRQVRDFHALESHLKEIKKICRSGGFNEAIDVSQGIIISLSYDSTIVLIEHLKACCDIASSRPLNWQKFCKQNLEILVFFFQVSFLLDEGVSPSVLTLLQLALCTPANTKQPLDCSGGIKVPVTILQREASLSDINNLLKEQQNLAATLAKAFISSVDKRLLSQFIQCFLLESNLSSLRWQTHVLIFNIYKCFEESPERIYLLEILWDLWNKVPSYGRKAVQFVDLLAYFTLRIHVNENKESEYIEKALNILRIQNKLLVSHPNSTLYNTLQSLVEFDGYYLESEPCLVCNNPEVNYTNVKLSSLKVDSRFTTTTQIVKLVGSQTISKIILRISDIKRAKMVKSLNIYYNNRAVQSVVELKNKIGIWHKAKKCHLAPGLMEVKIEFALPIVACYLMIEYADFYENIQTSSETLQCPRCSASVPANPGVCGSCGENVFQCHKCRAINYDEKDPFLCNSCGYCKYAKFDFTLTAKPTFAVDPIENEEDRKKTIHSINSLLDKADRAYKSLISHKPTLELLLLKIQEHGFMDKMSVELLGIVQPGSMNNMPTSSSYVNRAIYQVAQKYCVDCKGSFDELSRIIQKILASRKELVDYDNIQREQIVKPKGGQNKGATRRDSKVIVSMSSASGRCYGCASAVLEHCITLLKALGSLPKYRKALCSSGILKELVDYNLRTGSSNLRQEVRSLLVTLTLDNEQATDELNNMLMDRIHASLESASSRSDFAWNTRHEIALLIGSLEREDSCWEKRLRCVFKLFLRSLSYKNPAVLESITLPCLKLLINLIKPDSPTSRKNKEKTTEQVATVSCNESPLKLIKWLKNDPDSSFEAWRKRCAKRKNVIDKKSKEAIRAYYLIEKFGLRWLNRIKKYNTKRIVSLNSSWLRGLLFNKFSRTVRVMSCSLVEALFQIPIRQKYLIDMLTTYLDDLGTSGEYSQEFFSLYHSIIQQDHWKFYLALKGVLLHFGTLITNEIEKLSKLEESTLNSDLSEGLALRMLVDLLTIFAEVEPIRKQYKSRLVAFILNGYLSLRKLVVQRTKIINETQDNLLELLEEMTSGNELETSSFMAVCVDCVNKCKLDDLTTPVFIFERLCSIIYPEENDTSEFTITLEKDPQQEDFLQGRMLGNPYPSNEPGMGPLMRDIKNKICQDCELIALLEDDFGMELLVCNKIISLDLPVKEVYKKIWLAEDNEGDSMKIVYRMRGLMGDATEEFIGTLDSKNTKDLDSEQVYKMANVMVSCKGLEVILQRLKIVKDLSPRSKPLLLVLLKLFVYCIKVSKNRKRLVDPELGAIAVLLSTLKLSIGESDTGRANIVESILIVMESILVEASTRSKEEFDNLCLKCATKEDILYLLRCAELDHLRGNSNVMTLLMKVIPLLALSDNERVLTLLDHFKKYLNFNKFDFEHTKDDSFQIDCFCLLLSGIERNEIGNRLKDLFVQENIVENAIDYLRLHAPPVRSSLLAASEEWKEFTQKPALKYVLKILTGLCAGHAQSQNIVAAESIPIIHGLEQLSSDSHVGSLAEMLLEALKCENDVVSKKIENVRRQTKEEKKRLAMAVRQKQLGELGMKANERGQVMAKSSILKQVEDLDEEQGLICIICREGYKFEPNKVLGIYTFTKKCNVEPFEMKTRKTSGYSTVTHFNVVHVDCHTAAVRHARGRDEWESAALQNSNTKCNGLLPIWGPSVQESAFASCLSRHNTYLHECTGHRDIGYNCTIHDIKLLLLKFAGEESFSVDSGGGGPQSNIHLIPYMIHMALYVINTTRSGPRESKKMSFSFLDLPLSKHVENCFDAEGVYYWMVMCLLIHPKSFWITNRTLFLSRVLLCSHARACLPKGGDVLNDRSVREWSIYKSGCVFWGLIDALYRMMFNKIKDEDWTLGLAEYIRNNDQALLESGDKILTFYERDLLGSTSFAEFCDVMYLPGEVNPETFIEYALQTQ